MPCKRSSAAPIPFGVGFLFLGHAVSLRQLRHDQLHAVSCRFVNLSAILSYVHPAIDAETFAVPSDQHSDDERDDRISIHSIHAFHEECDNLSGVMRLSEVNRGYPEPTRAQMPQNGEKLVFSSS